jgi:hypothetical protein
MADVILPPGPITAPFPHYPTGASSQSDPIVEVITELCEYCVELKNDIVVEPGTPAGGLGIMYHITKNSGSEECRLCEMIAARPSARML